ncbi:hypothetical protein [uncultured Clostridium sp.]|uniref:hypothetical protein n=1 Tax=uncultured Clostridium sp. TaxID=59620 RepID=UPI0025E92100|nr:hypothetical protein [uncultured Clostridium sp.]
MGKRKFIKTKTSLIALVMLGTLGSCIYTTPVQAATMKDSKKIVDEMGIGWNLGNTLDCIGSWINSKDPSAYETA